MSFRKILTDKEQEDHLNNYWKTHTIVTFTYPEPPIKRKGTLLDRFVVYDGEYAGVVYWNLIDQIKFEHDPDNLWLRITYYRYLKNEIVRTKKGKITNRRWIFAGQTSFSDPIKKFEELFVKAIKEKKWIRPLFKDIFKQCTEELK
jgi:hypothetical protein